MAEQEKKVPSSNGFCHHQAGVPPADTIDEDMVAATFTGPISSSPVKRCEPTNLTVAVVIPVFQGGELFRHCLESLRAATTAPDEIVVVADGDSDGSGQLASELGIRVLRTAQRTGPAQARNLGARAVRSDILFFID